MDFRNKDYLHKGDIRGTVPLIYPANLVNNSVVWPRKSAKKLDSIVISERTKKRLVPQGHYVLVRRMSSKEDSKRVVAALSDPRQFSSQYIGFENHLNYYHAGGVGLDSDVARGLTAYLNSTLVDCYFRQFNGHTQVNATDLRNIRYPNLEQLRKLGRALPDVSCSLEVIDEFIDEVL